MDFWIWAIILFFIIIIGILIIGFIIARPWTQKDVPLNQPCDSSKLCIAGTTCTNGSCKSDPGQFCQNLSDCTSVSVGCINNVCSTTEMIIIR